MQIKEIFWAGYMWLQDNIAQVLVNLVTAVIIILIGFTIGKFVGRIVEKILKEVEIDAVFKVKKSMPLRKVISEAVSLTAYLIAIILALNKLGITSLILWALLWMMAITALAAIVLYLKDFLPNLIFGLILRNKSLVHTGDFAKAKSFEGTVENAGLLEYRIRTKKKDLLQVPSAYLYYHIKDIKTKHSH